jgi:hypothetical protein
MDDETHKNINLWYDGREERPRKPALSLIE